jgi:hypothetical protein
MYLQHDMFFRKLSSNQLYVFMSIFLRKSNIFKLYICQRYVTIDFDKTVQSMLFSISKPLRQKL